MIDNHISQFQTLEQPSQANKVNTNKSSIVMNIISKDDLFSTNSDIKINNDFSLVKKENDENNPYIINVNSNFNNSYNFDSVKNCGHQHYSNIKKFTYQKNQKNFINFKKIPSQSNDLNENTGGFQISLKYVIDKYPHLNNINQFSLGITELVKIQKSPRFFVIKSFTEEDIHKSIKYNCWSSTKEGNKKLDSVYKECKANESDVFLFFSMNGSGRFVGVAKMMSVVDENMTFDYWAVDGVWKGLFEVKWIFIKDVPNKYLQEINLPNNGLKPVTNSRDTQEIPRKEGEIFLKFMELFKYNSSILQHFQHYDERQKIFENSSLFIAN